MPCPVHAKPANIIFIKRNLQRCFSLNDGIKFVITKLSDKCNKYIINT